MSFPPTTQKYTKVTESLKDRFGQEDMLVEMHIRELLMLVIKNVGRSLTVHTVYNKLEPAIRALETLGIISEKCAPLLYPSAESSLSEDILRTCRRIVDTYPTPADLLGKLMKFIKTEVEAEQRISMAMDGFGHSKRVFHNKASTFGST
ncbi:hypothetical protein AVEN_185825-1 [Araneus ventricosus]|uniref:Uncharacterized protein n=1 Tax=Araneus ventricosus TaxID=182803 RepID=A0A4Y2WIX1_ARAVE|nr:hypothetical protein AVEN_185825-1 [Araneus ventricosus]